MTTQNVFAEEYLRLVLVAMAQEAKNCQLNQGFACVTVRDLDEPMFKILPLEIGTEKKKALEIFTDSMRVLGKLMAETKDSMMLKILKSRLIRFEGGVMAFHQEKVIIVVFVGGTEEENLQIANLGMRMILRVTEEI